VSAAQIVRISKTSFGVLIVAVTMETRMTGASFDKSASGGGTSTHAAQSDKSKPQQIVVVSSSRSGTNYFLDTYAQCFPKDIVLREIFRRRGDSLGAVSRLIGASEADIVSNLLSDPLVLWTRIVEASAATGRSVIAKIFYYHARPESNLWLYFERNGVVVHLIRKNLLDSFVSLKVAQSTGAWVSRRGSESLDAPRRMSIDAREAEKFVRERANHISWARAFFSGSDCREIFYEDIQRSPEACVDAILGMKLRDGAPSRAVQFGATTKKHARPPNCAFIENYPEVAHLDRDWQELEDVLALSK
jgi:hypothetical protein